MQTLVKLQYCLRNRTGSALDPMKKVTESVGMWKNFTWFLLVSAVYCPVVHLAFEAFLIKRRVETNDKLFGEREREERSTLPTPFLISYSGLIFPLLIMADVQFYLHSSIQMSLEKNLSDIHRWNFQEYSDRFLLTRRAKPVIHIHCYLKKSVSFLYKHIGYAKRLYLKTYTLLDLNRKLVSLDFLIPWYEYPGLLVQLGGGKGGKPFENVPQNLLHMKQFQLGIQGRVQRRLQSSDIAVEKLLFNLFLINWIFKYNFNNTLPLSCHMVTFTV